MCLTTNQPCVFFSKKGKTNHGSKLCGRSTRHKEVLQCSIGAFSFYLALRFYQSKEFDCHRPEDWCENKKWFDIKLLVDASRSDANFEKPMSNDTYAKAVKSVLGQLCIASNHWLHLGRGIGPKILEMLECEREEIRTLGNWDPKIQEVSYSTKLPMKAIRNISGFVLAGGVHCNLRTVALASEALVLMTPFAFAVQGQKDMEVLMQNGSAKCTALAFLKCMTQIAQVFLQDSAAMWLRYPERKNHPIFRLDVFSSSEWQVRVAFRK
jgi:hypothetical protein